VDSHATLFQHSPSPAEFIRRADAWLQSEKPKFDQWEALRKAGAADSHILNDAIQQAQADKDQLALAIYKAQKNNLSPDQRIQAVDKAFDEARKANPNDRRVAAPTLSSPKARADFENAAEARIQKMDALIAAATDEKTGTISLEKLKSLSK
jgi:hypothetical protein